MSSPNDTYTTVQDGFQTIHHHPRITGWDGFVQYLRGIGNTGHFFLSQTTTKSNQDLSDYMDDTSWGGDFSFDDQEPLVYLSDLSYCNDDSGGFGFNLMMRPGHEPLIYDYQQKVILQDPLSWDKYGDGMPEEPFSRWLETAFEETVSDHPIPHDQEPGTVTLSGHDDTT